MANTDFQPIPGASDLLRFWVKADGGNGVNPVAGVWYENADDENDQRYLYAPHPSGMCPWWGGNNQWLRADEVPPNLKVWYNPHPPTRTEWGIKHLEHDCPSEHIGRVISYGDSRQLMNEEFPNDGHYVRVARQVTETEWKEVIDV